MATHTHHPTITPSAKPSAARMLVRRRQVESAIVISRNLKASQQRVFRALTVPALLKRWWAPKGWSSSYVSVDLQKGGLFHYCMRSPEGQEIWGRGLFRAVEQPRRLAYIDSFADEEGNRVEPSHYGMSKEHPAEARVSFSLAKIRGGTKLTLRHEIPRSFRERKMMEHGWNEMFDRLSELLAETAVEVRVGRHETTFTRIFAVPRERLFRAWLDSELLAEWWGPHHFTNPLCKSTPHEGGTLRIVMRSPEGIDQTIKGKYLEIAEPMRLMFTVHIDKAPAEWLDQFNQLRHVAQGTPAPELTNTLFFDDLGGWTRLTLSTCFASQEDCSAIMQSGYTEGMSESLERLEELFTSCSLPG